MFYIYIYIYYHTYTYTFTYTYTYTYIIYHISYSYIHSWPSAQTALGQALKGCILLNAAAVVAWASNTWPDAAVVGSIRPLDLHHP